jgi:tryptophanyl-tRNA synthetase
MTRDVASRFNQKFGETLIIPEEQIQEQTMLIPGVDGEKMSKSRGNTIDIFLPEKELRKQIMSIVSDSTPLEEPKNPDTCNVFALYKLLAENDQIIEMQENYKRGGYGFGHAKQALFELILTKFEKERIDFNRLMSNQPSIDSALQVGAKKARIVAKDVLQRIRSKVGY